MDEQQYTQPQPQLQPIAGTILIIADSDDVGRIIDQLNALTKRDDLWRYTGGISSLRGSNWHRYITQAMIYLELPAAQWTSVGRWCESAYQVGLITSYHAATIGQLRVAGK
jgi:hypothetical protein